MKSQPSRTGCAISLVLYKGHVISTSPSFMFNFTHHNNCTGSLFKDTACNLLTLSACSFFSMLEDRLNLSLTREISAPVSTKAFVSIPSISMLHIVDNFSRDAMMGAHSRPSVGLYWKSLVVVELPSFPRVKPRPLPRKPKEPDHLAPTPRVDLCLLQTLAKWPNIPQL